VWHLTAADLPPLLALQQLRELRLIQWPDLEQRPFEQRPCAVLPHLEVFERKGRL
jgi:hypothetical protein